MRALARRLRSDEGVTALLFALLLPAILGMQALTVDATRTFVERRTLQNAVDAAALAAAVYLPSTDPAVLTQARLAAIDYAGRNGVTIGGSDVTFSTDREAYDRVAVQAHADVTFAFAPTFGVTLATVGSQSVAQLGRLGGMADVLPWGVDQPVGGFQFGGSYCLKLGSNGGGGACSGAIQGNFQALDIDNLGTNSASAYRDRLAGGSDTVVTVGQVKSVITGNMVGPTQQGIGCNGNGGRLNGDSSTFDDVVEDDDEGGGYRVLEWADPHLALVPIVQFTDPSHAEVLGFAVFFIEQCGSNGAVIGRFIDTMVPGGQWSPLSGGSNFGTYMTRLIE